MLLIHIEQNTAIDIFIKRILSGEELVFESKKVERILAMLCFDKLAAKVKPPSNSIITEFHMVDII